MCSLWQLGCWFVEGQRGFSLVEFLSPNMAVVGFAVTWEEGVVGEDLGLGCHSVCMVWVVVRSLMVIWNNGVGKRVCNKGRSKLASSGSIQSVRKRKRYGAGSGE